MARGRQKAKHMKVARKLKYYSPEPDLDALQRELSGVEDETDDANFSDSDDDDGEYWSGSIENSWADTDWDDSPSR